jgi:hypothetical protein
MIFNLVIFNVQNNVILSEMKWSRKILFLILEVLDFSIPLRFIRNDKSIKISHILVIK